MKPRPQVIVNCAMSADGKIALPTRKQLRISCDEDIKRMYKLRNECDAVLVGVKTILSDDPKLTVKNTVVPNPKQPLRVILDSTCRTPVNALALNITAKTLILTTKGHEKKYPGEHIEVIGCTSDKQGHVDLSNALSVLAEKNIKKLMVEGGGTVIWSFLSQKLIDELYVYIGPMIIGGEQTPTLADGEGIKHEQNLINLTIVEVKKLGPGILVHYKMRP